MRRYNKGQQRAYLSSSRGRPQGYDLLKLRSVPPALGAEMKTKSVEQINAMVGSETPEISDCQFIASYNLMEGLQKNILVPGKPPIWTPLPGNTVLRPDSGDYYRDENAARFPEHPLEPAVQSIFVMNKFFNPSEIDIFGCGSTLGDLVRFVTECPQPFTFTAQVLGSTVFFVRRNMSPTELIDNVHGFGHAFSEAYTTWSHDVKGSSSHQRIIKYSFGGLKCLVRFEADGYILDQADESDDEDLIPALDNGQGNKASIEVDGLVEDLVKKTFNAASAAVERDGEPLVIRVQGGRTAQSSLFDLKTRASWKKRDDILAEQLPRLWVRQIPKFILGFHSRGSFDTPDVLDVTSEIYGWEQDSKAALRRLAVLLKYIRQLAFDTVGGKLEVRGTESGTLHFHRLSAEEMERYEALSTELRKQWSEG